MDNKSNLFYFLLLIWPFVFLLPLSSGYIAMGNDFDLIYYSYKKYIFEFWQDGQLPFWSPSEGAGFSLIYNPFAQFFYIPSWILFFICDLKNSFSLYDYLIYTIFGISIYCLGQYQWLKSIKFSNNEIKYVVTLLVPTTLLITIYGLFSPVYSAEIFMAGLFGRSGGLTNWLAIHMLFEKVPLLFVNEP